jgi:hypothetical protein
MVKKRRKKSTAKRTSKTPEKKTRPWLMIAGIVVILLGLSGLVYNQFRQIKHTPKAIETDLSLIQEQEMEFYNLVLKSPTALFYYNWYLKHRVRSVIVSEGQEGFNLQMREPQPENFFMVAQCRQQDLCFQKFKGHKGVIGFYNKDINTLFLLDAHQYRSPLSRPLVLVHEVKHAYIVKKKINYPNQKAEEYDCYLLFSQILNELTDNKYQRAVQKQLNRYLLTGKTDLTGFINSISMSELETEINLPGITELGMDVEIYAIELWAQTVYPQNKQEAINQVLAGMKLDP